MCGMVSAIARHENPVQRLQNNPIPSAAFAVLVNETDGCA
jgi:hypothetical protein